MSEVLNPMHTQCLELSQDLVAMLGCYSLGFTQLRVKVVDGKRASNHALALSTG